MSEKSEGVGKLFMHGRSQALRLPKAFRFEGTEVYLRRVGAEVVVSAKPKPALATLFESLGEFEPGFKLQRAQPESAQERAPVMPVKPSGRK